MSTQYPAEYYQALLRELATDTKLETAQRLVVIQLADLCIKYEGSLQWPVRDLAEALGVSRSIVGVVLSNLSRYNPFERYISVEHPETGSYMIRTHPWHPPTESPEDTESKAPERAKIAVLPLPSAVRQLLLDLQTKRVERVDRWQISDVTVTIVATRGTATLQPGQSLSETKKPPDEGDDPSFQGLTPIQQGPAPFRPIPLADS